MPAPTSPQATPILSVINQSNIQDDGVTPNKLQDDGEYTMGSLTLGTAAGNFLKLPVLTAAPTGITPTSGVTYYDSDELNLIIGKKSSEIKRLLGYNGRNEIVHRDYLTLNE